MEITITYATRIVNFLYSKVNYHVIVCDINSKVLADSEKKREGKKYPELLSLGTDLEKIKVNQMETTLLGDTLEPGIYLSINDKNKKLGVLGFIGDSDKIELFAQLALSLIIMNIHDKFASQKLHENIIKMHSELEHAAAAIEQLTASSEELVASSQSVENLSKKASTEVSNTTNVISSIRHIAQQINLLGLNAAIEAARVGELGKGFSVVASEVRKLADESNQSSVEISNQLSQFKKNVDQVLSDVENNNNITREQSTATQEIAQMVERVRKIGSEMFEIVENH